MAEPLTPMGFAVDQPGTLEHAEVLGHRGQAHVERLGQLSDVGGAASQSRENLAPGRVRQCRERPVEPYRLFNHQVEYKRAG